MPKPSMITKTTSMITRNAGSLRIPRSDAGVGSAPSCTVRLRLPLSVEELDEPFGGHHRREIRVAARRIREDARVTHAKPVDTVHPQGRLADRAARRRT